MGSPLIVTLTKVECEVKKALHITSSKKWLSGAGNQRNGIERVYRLYVARLTGFGRPLMTIYNLGMPSRIDY